MKHWYPWWWPEWAVAFLLARRRRGVTRFLAEFGLHPSPGVCRYAERTVYGDVRAYREGGS